MTDFLGSNVTVMVSDMNRAIKFYTETLGLTLKQRFGDHWADIEGPGISIGLHSSGNNIKVGENLSIAFKVKNLKEAVAALENKGITFKLYDDKNVNLAFFSDPDSNTLYLAEAW